MLLQLFMIMALMFPKEFVLLRFIHFFAWTTNWICPLMRESKQKNFMSFSKRLRISLTLCVAQAIFIVVFVMSKLGLCIIAAFTVLLHLFASFLIAFPPAQLSLWTWESVPMVMLVQFIVTRWQSKYGMLQSLIANKDTIRALCASDDDECQALHDKDLSDAEWKTLEVSFVFCSLYFFSSNNVQTLIWLFRNHFQFSRLWPSSASSWKVKNTYFLLHIGLHYQPSRHFLFPTPLILLLLRP